ncbi:GH92 family glycosyl hydrolase [Parasediminibacterium sp. JCM 36343]|uniref:GH92 family glycosyl hydrolase n=1 Tax=Parasediminibacterium sp. JCM 36343 TaxID=3374279 RepID=UPI003978E0DC
MQLIKNLFVFSFCLSNAVVTLAQEKTDVVNKVDPFIGVHGGGNMHPAATLPYSVVSLGPDVEYVQSPSGYGYAPNKKLIGFSHARTSGTGGGGRYGNFAVLPQVGNIQLVNKAFDAKNEFASPGYYTCDVGNSGINVALTLANPHVGFHQYTFAEVDTANILLDVSSTRLTKEKSYCTEAHVEIVSDKIVKGYAKYKGGWGGDNPYTIYFYAEFDKPAIDKGTWDGDILSRGKMVAQSALKNNLYLGAFFKFLVNKKSNQVKLKLAMSYTSIEHAEAYFNQSPGWEFNTFKKSCDSTWAHFLNRIKVSGGTATQQQLFYTSFYRQAMIPRDLTGDNPLWKSNEPHFWDFYTFWDTYRTTNPLLTIIDTKKASEIVRCLIDVQQHKGWLPEAWTGGSYGSVQGGSNPDVVVAEAIVKGIKGFDYELAYKAMVNDVEHEAPDPSIAGRYVNIYNKYGYIPVENWYKTGFAPTGTSRSIEYSYNDFCIGLAAKKLGKTKAYNQFLNRSSTIFKTLYCDSLQVFWAKDSLGRWIAGGDKGETNGKMLNGAWMGWKGPYYEGSPYSYSCSAVQDVNKMIQLHGGKEKFISFLDEIFDGNHFEADNEPGMHLPYMYIYAGQPHKTYERLREVFKTKYNTTSSGWPGNDDAGTTSAWYIWGNMGIYPMAGQDIYLLTTPTFLSSQFELKDGKSFSIEAKELSAANTYIQSATLNGKPWNQAWIRHRDIMKGGKLVLIMGAKQSAWGSSNLPPSFDKILAD